MTAAEILRAASKLPWTKGEMARDIKGKPCDWWSDSASRWDVIGALHRASGPHKFARTLAFHVLAHIVEPGPDAIEHPADVLRIWNDSMLRSQEDVRAAMLSASMFLESDVVSGELEAA